MKFLPSAIVLATVLIAFPSFSSAESGQGQQSSGGQALETIEFPSNDNCTANQPCRTVMGEIMRVEEMYVLKQPNGSEIHVNIEPETKVRGLHKEGDKVAAQLNSRGVAQAVVKLKEIPKPGLEAPGKTLDDLR
ncbi:MAG: hypothetical protein CV089_00135 [Nitrospira sp. WS110]|nr:hypothetical protein [Nitrospira sp. WS110]